MYDIYDDALDLDKDFQDLPIFFVHYESRYPLICCRLSFFFPDIFFLFMQKKK